eukprot:CAMPEP_0178397996 /NCGR_PEP_ID=MMETSP0689_2-20121128/14548_1 /TAXON_ID=160604 /ORGANISM="Amphidinium massartii, Strain CS-259" /LENGTH=82 /DNA_ID=CAMNT_0020018751 /DNA_START=281 /DNA_END=525 /DNA_ORIENTATION=-
MECFADAVRETWLPEHVVTQTDVALRERFFGTLEGKANTHYADVWQVDIQNPCAQPYSAESADSVQQRTARLVCALDKQIAG